MGHIRLGALPGDRKWRAVVELLVGDAPDRAVVRASAVAAEREIGRAKNEPLLSEAVRLLCLIPQAARGSHFARDLRTLGLGVPDDPRLSDVLLAVGRHLDSYAADVGRTDFGELSRRALLGTLSNSLGQRLPSLFAAEAGDLRNAAAELGKPKEFSRLARAFFGKLTADTLSSWLDRTLSAQVGPDRRFRSAADRSGFDRALSQYSAEATRIIHEFAAGWYGKTLFREGTITSQRAAGFAAFAVTKIGAELRRKREPDD